MKGEGNQQDYGMRISDPRVARFLSIDPLSPEYPELTPYQFASNRPIDAVDIDGAEAGSAPGPGPSSPLPGSYINPLNNIDMTGTPKTVTSLNGNYTVAISYTKPLEAPRNYLQYWNLLMRRRPEIFSPANVAKISNGASPKVDQTWIEGNPTHVGFEGGRLIHHHNEQGVVASALPETVHQKYDKALHPLKSSSRGRVGGGLGLTANLFAIGVELLSDNPHTTWNSTFGNGLNIGQLYANPEGGYYQILNSSRQYENGKLIKESRTVELYHDMGKDKDGKYIGVDKYDERVIETDYKNHKSRVLGPAA